MMKAYGIGFSMLLASIAYGEFTYSDGLVDIPVATAPRETYVSLIPSGSFAVGDDPNSFVGDLSISLSIAGRGEIGLSAYTLKNYSLNTRLTILAENEAMPAVALGIDNITYREWMSSVGDGNSVGLSDDLGYQDKRPKEAFSFFVVATKNFSDLAIPFSTTVGVGRGRYVGKGPLSQYTNSDVFFDSDNTLAVGLFGGIALELVPSFSAILEYDGRDGNIGVQYDHEFVSLKLAFTHVEQLRSSGEIGPRVALGLALRSPVLASKKEGRVSGTVFDTYSETPLNASITIPDADQNPIRTDGDYTITLSPGTYRLQVASAGYFTKQFKVAIRADQTTELDVPLLHVARSESLSLHLETAERLAEEGNLLAAREEYSAVLEIYPNHRLANGRVSELNDQIDQLMVHHRTRALQYQEAGRLNQALSEWSEFLRLKPGDPEAVDAVENLRARAMQRPVEPETPAPVKVEQKPPPQRKTERTPKLTTEEVEVLYDQALLHYFNEEYEQALELLKRILKDYPNHQKAKKYLDRTERILGL